SFRFQRIPKGACRPRRIIPGSRGLPLPRSGAYCVPWYAKEAAMAGRVTKSGLQVDGQLARFIEEQALPGTGVGADAFWSGFAAILADLAPKNRALLAKRQELQDSIDAWHRARKG